MTRVKLLAILICTSGVVVVSLHHSEADESSGDASHSSDLGLVWAFGYLGLYATFMLLWGARVGRRFEAGGRDVTLLMLGLIGMSTLVLWWWPMVAIEGLRLFPSSSRQGLLVGSVALIAIFCNVTLMLATTVSSPSFVAVGSVLQIPMSAASDYVLHGDALDGVSCCGYVLIAVGFLLFTLKSRGGTGGKRDAELLDACSHSSSPPHAPQEPAGARLGESLRVHESCAQPLGRRRPPNGPD